MTLGQGYLLQEKLGVGKNSVLGKLSLKTLLTLHGREKLPRQVE